MNTDYMKDEFFSNQVKSFLLLLEREKRSRAEIKCQDSLLIFQKFHRHLEDKLSYQLKVNEICEFLNVNSKQLGMAVSLYARTTTKDFINDRLILEAKRLLSYSSMSIKEIAYEIDLMSLPISQNISKSAQKFPPKNIEPK